MSSTCVWSAFEAQSTMACDSIPLILAGLRLHRQMTRAS